LFVKDKKKTPTVIKSIHASDKEIKNVKKQREVDISLPLTVIETNKIVCARKS